MCRGAQTVVASVVGVNSLMKIALSSRYKNVGFVAGIVDEVFALLLFGVCVCVGGR